MIKKIKSIFLNRLRLYSNKISVFASEDIIYSKYQKYSLRYKKYFSQNLNHPLAYTAMSRVLTGKSIVPKQGFDMLENYTNIKDNWLKKNSLNIFKSEFLPTQQITGSFGNYFPLFYYLINLNNLKKINDKPNIIIKTKEKITNKELFKYFSKYINLIQNTSNYYRLSYFSDVNKAPLENGIPFFNNYLPMFAAVNLINQRNIKTNKKTFNFFKISSNDFLKGSKILKKIGIPSKSWYVVLHVRESRFGRLYNSKIETYIDAIKYIISKGGVVIRVGDKSMSPAPKMKGLIDYAHSKYKCEFMDVFLAATCKFCIGTSSGYWAVPIYFNKPVALVNYLPVLDYFCLNSKSLFLHKNITYKNSKRNLSKKDLFKIKNGSLTHEQQYKVNGLQFTDNTSEQLLNATKEMFGIVENKINNNFLRYNFKLKRDIKPKKIFKSYKLKCLGYLSQTCEK